MLCCIFPVCHRAIIIIVIPRSLNENELAEFVRSVLPFQSSARDDTTTLLERESGLTESEMGGNERELEERVCVPNGVHNHVTEFSSPISTDDGGQISREVFLCRVLNGPGMLQGVGIKCSSDQYV